MIDFTTLKGLTIREGVVTKITDASGRVLWAAGGKIVLEVEKITSNTYAGETTYENEQFILLDIYPKTNGRVKVTYGGLTKTITDTSGAEEPNAQQVFFGTFNGVSDSVTTPASGELTIEGDCIGFACSSYQSGSKSYNIGYSSCITSVIEWGDVSSISSYAFYGCTGLTSINIPTSIRSVGLSAFSGCTGLASVHTNNFDTWCRIKFANAGSNPLSNGGNLYVNDVLITHVTLPSYAADMTYTFAGYQNLKTVSFQSGIVGIGEGVFYNCNGLTSIELPNSLASIGNYAFYDCDSLALTSLPNSLASIGNYAFYDCYNLTLTSLPSSLTSIGNYAFTACWGISIGEIPEGVTYIGEYAFGMDASKSSSEITEDNMPNALILPSTIVEIGDYAFIYASASQVYPSNLFETVTIRATIPPTIGASTFGYTSQSASYIPNQIKAPVGCGATYKATEGWSKYADVIVEGS